MNRRNVLAVIGSGLVAAITGKTAAAGAAKEVCEKCSKDDQCRSGKCCGGVCGECLGRRWRIRKNPNGQCICVRRRADGTLVRRDWDADAICVE